MSMIPKALCPSIKSQSKNYSYELISGQITCSKDKEISLLNLLNIIKLVSKFLMAFIRKHIKYKPLLLSLLISIAQVNKPY